MISYFSIVVLMVSGVELILAIRSSDNTLISLVKFLSIISPPFGEIITKYDNFIKERKTVIDYDKQLDLEILFMEMFEKCPDGDLAEILLEEIQNIAECSLEQIKEKKGWE